MYSDTPLTDEFFVKNYAEGRKKFRQACEIGGLSVTAEPHPEAICPEDGTPLSLDWAWAGPRNARKVVWMSCGTHGLEAAAGLASILQWFEMGRPLPPDTAMVLVHAVNPFGWAYHSRCNEDGIDLNRNCLDHTAGHPTNEAYEEFHPVIQKTGPQPEALEDFLRAFGTFSQEKGYGYAVSGVVAGQYQHEDGLSFGGKSESWSWKQIKKIAQTAFERADKIAIIDWHTGIGDFGKPFFIIDQSRDSEAFSLADNWYQDDEIHCDAVIGDVDPDYRGIMTHAISQEILAKNSAAGIASMVVEWGTYDVSKMLQALMMDRWLRLHRDEQDCALVEGTTAELIERFYPADENWRSGVLIGAKRIISQTLSGVESW
ncbi:MAG: DUF2817 domain-containing protein [Parvularcula sp.]